MDSEAAAIDEKLKVAQAALMLTPGEQCKLPSEQVLVPGAIVFST